MFENADVFVFTMGLTEAWQSKSDGAVVPLAPGVVGANVPDGSYLPKNFTVTEVLSDLEQLIVFLREKNPRLRIILTVSPVPLIATFEQEHVLLATTYSKSVLRAAAGEMAKCYSHVDYFPSFEIVTGSYSRGRYFADNLREVTGTGVEHVMKCFLKHYAGIAPRLSQPDDLAERARKADWFQAEARAALNIVCDEEEIEFSATPSAATDRNHAG
jgi:hypothetical protein